MTGNAANSGGGTPHRGPDPAQAERQRSPRRPPDDAMPPYTPGGVPAPEGRPAERPDEGSAPPSTVLPKRTP